MLLLVSNIDFTATRGYREQSICRNVVVVVVDLVSSVGKQ